MNAIFVNVSSSYFKYFHVFNRSLQRNYPNYPALIVVWQDLTEPQLAFLKTIPRAHAYDVNSLNVKAGPRLVGRPEDPTIYYTRFTIFSDRFSQFEKILYLDTDITILKPLDKLFQHSEFTIFQEAYHGVHPIIRTDIQEEKLVRLIEEDQIPVFPEAGVNAGVFMAPQKVRTQENFNALLELKERYNDYLIWADQSVMDLWILKNFMKITVDYRFNFQPLLLDQRRAKDAYKDIHIFHFNAMVKTPYLELLMNMSLFCWKISLVGRSMYYLFHRFFFTQNTIRYPKLNWFLNFLDRRFKKL